MTPEYESQKFKANFVTACQCEGFLETIKFVNNLILEAEKNGRDYWWEKEMDDYWLPEKTQIDYEIMCPRFELVEVKELTNSFRRTTFQTIAYIVVNGKDLKIPFGYFSQGKGDFNQNELSLFAFSISYLRFRIRDGIRNADVARWDSLVESNIASTDTSLLFREDKLAAHLWANYNFPDSFTNAWIGKCGEFIFRGWASQRGIVLSPVEIKFDRKPDKYDFTNTVHNFFRIKNSFFLDKEEIKIDVKTFQVQDYENRDHWNISVRCLEGEHKQDLFVFVIIDDDFVFGKVVGALFPNQVKKFGTFHQYTDEFSGYNRSYYEVKPKDLQNTHYLHAWLDTDGQMFSLMETGGATNPLTHLIKSYPIDPTRIDEYDDYEYDPQDLDDYGIEDYLAVDYYQYSVVLKPNLVMYIPKQEPFCNKEL